VIIAVQVTMSAKYDGAKEQDAQVPKPKLRFPANQTNWVIEYAVFLHGLAQQCRVRQKRNLVQG